MVRTVYGEKTMSFAALSEFQKDRRMEALGRVRDARRKHARKMVKPGDQGSQRGIGACGRLYTAGLPHAPGRGLHPVLYLTSFVTALPHAGRWKRRFSYLAAISIFLPRAASRCFEPGPLSRSPEGAED
jgi:hypothetical protein